MATVFMRWLETNPKDYERGIRLLTLGQLGKLKQDIADDYVQDDMFVLEIGCGVGDFCTLLARRGARVIGIDSSESMLIEANKRIPEELVRDGRVVLKQMDASQIREQFPEASFDLIVSSLVFSELSELEQGYALESCRQLLKSDGRLLVADEVIPNKILSRVLYAFARWPLALLTFLLTRTTSSPLKRFEDLAAQSGLSSRRVGSRLFGSLALYEASRQEAELEDQAAGRIFPRLRHRVSLRTLLIDLWGLFFRVVPPYPKTPPGLYRIGHPNRNSSVLVTGNFDLTVRRLAKVLDGRVATWLLVGDSAGINVWCAAGGGYFTAERVIAAVNTSRLDQVVDHRLLILPQLCANGVDGWKVRRETGYQIKWGPVRAGDIPAYLDSQCTKTDAMRTVFFPLRDRLEMGTVTLGFYGLLILLPVLIFWPALFWPLLASLVALSYFYIVVHPWLPGRDGLQKAVPLAIIALSGLFIYSWFFGGLETTRLFDWTVGLVGLSLFTAAELQGMSPLMRGEQANWGWEITIGAILGLIYWVVPQALGWR